MKKHELLKYAYENYPKGCVAKFKGIGTKHTSNGKFVLLDINNDGNIGVFSGEGLNCFYYKGEWAKIVSDKKRTEITIELNNGQEATVFKVGQINFQSPRSFLIDADIDLIVSTLNKLK